MSIQLISLSSGDVGLFVGDVLMASRDSKYANQVPVEDLANSISSLLHQSIHYISMHTPEVVNWTWDDVHTCIPDAQLILSNRVLELAVNSLVAFIESEGRKDASEGLACTTAISLLAEAQIGAYGALQNLPLMKSAILAYAIETFPEIETDKVINRPRG